MKTKKRANQVDTILLSIRKLQNDFSLCPACLFFFSDTVYFIFQINLVQPWSIWLVRSCLLLLFLFLYTLFFPFFDSFLLFFFLPVYIIWSSVVNVVSFIWNSKNFNLTIFPNNEYNGGFTQFQWNIGHFSLIVIFLERFEICSREWQNPNKKWCHTVLAYWDNKW